MSSFCSTSSSSSAVPPEALPEPQPLPGSLLELQPLPEPQRQATTCAVCRHHRRRCDEGCPMARYFPPGDPEKFLAVRRVFGYSNLTKMHAKAEALGGPDLANAAVEAMVWEAHARRRDPIYGSCGIVRELWLQLQAANAQIKNLQGLVSTYQKIQLIPQVQAQLPSSSSAAAGQLILHQQLQGTPQSMLYDHQSNQDLQQPLGAYTSNTAATGSDCKCITNQDYYTMTNKDTQAQQHLSCRFGLLSAYQEQLQLTNPPTLVQSSPSAAAVLPNIQHQQLAPITQQLQHRYQHHQEHQQFAPATQLLQYHQSPATSSETGTTGSDCGDPHREYTINQYGQMQHLSSQNMNPYRVDKIDALQMAYGNCMIGYAQSDCKRDSFHTGVYVPPLTIEPKADASSNLTSCADGGFMTNNKMW